MKKFIWASAFFIFHVFFSFAQNPLLIPPVLSGTVFNLDVRADSTHFYSAHATPTYGVNGNILGPTLILNKGDLVTMNVSNHLPTTTTMHWHGMHVPAYADGGPHQIIQLGATWSPSFEVKNEAGTFWYHPHGQNKTDLQVSKGIAGMIIVRDSLEASLNLPRTYGVDDFPIIVQTKCFDVFYQTAIATAFDTVPMVNATIDASLDVPAQVIRFRLLNGSSARSYLFGFSNNMNYQLIANDGGLLDTPVTLNRLLLSPGERAEVLIDFSLMQGQNLNLLNYGSQLPDGIYGAQTVGNGMAQIQDYSLNPLNGADFTLLQIHVIAPTANPVSNFPVSLVNLIRWNTSLANRTRTITFAPQQMGMQAMVEGPFTMNGQQFSMDTINDTTYLNHIEIWTLNNQTLIAHPFHIHDVQFYLTNVNGGPVPDYEKGKKDVVLVMPQQSVSFITKFEDFTDTLPYMYHCHLLHHEDDGMMGSFVVLPSTTGVREERLPTETIRIFPNPGNGRFNIHCTAKINDLEISNLTGQIIYQSKPDVTDFSIQLEKAGIYFLKVKTGNQVIAEKLLVQN